MMRLLDILRLAVSFAPACMVTGAACMPAAPTALMNSDPMFQRLDCAYLAEQKAGAFNHRTLGLRGGEAAGARRLLIRGLASSEVPDEAKAKVSELLPRGGAYECLGSADFAESLAEAGAYLDTRGMRMGDARAFKAKARDLRQAWLARSADAYARMTTDQANFLLELEGQLDVAPDGTRLNVTVQQMEVRALPGRPADSPQVPGASICAAAHPHPTTRHIVSYRMGNASEQPMPYCIFGRNVASSGSQRLSIPLPRHSAQAWRTVAAMPAGTRRIWLDVIQLAPPAARTARTSPDIEPTSLLREIVDVRALYVSKPEGAEGSESILAAASLAPGRAGDLDGLLNSARTISTPPAPPEMEPQRTVSLPGATASLSALKKPVVLALGLEPKGGAAQAPGVHLSGEGSAGWNGAAVPAPEEARQVVRRTAKRVAALAVNAAKKRPEGKRAPSELGIDCPAWHWARLGPDGPYRPKCD